MNMSFALTTEAMRNFAKTVTRRYGWRNIHQAQILWSVKKGMGLKKGEKVERIHEIQVLHNRWEPLNRMIKEPAYGEAEVILEGFPEMKPAEFVEMLCDHNKKLPHEEVNRIEFRFLIRQTHPLLKSIMGYREMTFVTESDGTIVMKFAENMETERKTFQKFRFTLD